MQGFLWHGASGSHRQEWAEPGYWVASLQGTARGCWGPLVLTGSEGGRENNESKGVRGGTDATDDGDSGDGEGGFL